MKTISLLLERQIMRYFVCRCLFSCRYPLGAWESESLRVLCILTASYALVYSRFFRGCLRDHFHFQCVAVTPFSLLPTKVPQLCPLLDLVFR